MIILPDDWYEKNGVRCPHLRPINRVEAEVREAFKWPTRICVAVFVVLLTVASLVVM